MRESRGEGRRRRFVRSKDQQKERKYFIVTLQFGWGAGGVVMNGGTVLGGTVVHCD